MLSNLHGNEITKDREGLTNEADLFLLSQNQVSCTKVDRSDYKKDLMIIAPNKLEDIPTSPCTDNVVTLLPKHLLLRTNITLL